MFAFWLQPERIDPHHSSRGYDVRSDIWSLGITLVSYFDSFEPQDVSDLIKLFIRN